MPKSAATIVTSRAKVKKPSGLLRLPKKPAWRSFREALFETLDRTAISDLIVQGSVSTERLVSSADQALHMTIDDVAHLISASSRTVNRRLQKSLPLNPGEADRAYRLARVFDLAVELIGDRSRASNWMRTPHRFLGEKTPLAMLETEIGTELVEMSLYTIAYGGVG